MRKSTVAGHGALVALLSIAGLVSACGSSGTSTLSPDGGSSGSGGSGGSGGKSGSGGSGGTGAIDCSNVGCAEAPLCEEECQAECGCCGCAPGETRDVGGTTYLCAGDCFAAPDPCACPADAPTDGAACDTACEGRACAYEDCAGAGLAVARCSSSAWTVAVGACGDQPCGPQGSSGGQTCDPGFACIQQTGGAQFPQECRQHECAPGLVSCACLGSSCPGECVQTGPLDFTCNTCPSGLCP